MELVSAFPEAWTIEDHDDPHPSDIQASEKTRQRYVLFVKVGVEAHLQEACVVCGLCQVEMGMTQCTECGFEFCEACNLKHHARGDARHHHRVLMEAFCYPEVRTDEAQRIAERLGVKATWAGELPESFQTLSQPEYLWPEVARIGSCLKEEAITEAHGQQLCEARCDSCDRQALFMCRDCEMQQCQSCSKKRHSRGAMRFHVISTMVRYRWPEICDVLPDLNGAAPAVQPYEQPNSMQHHHGRPI